MTNDVKSSQIISNHVKSCQIVSNHAESCQIKSNHLKPFQIMANHVKSWGIMSNHAKTHQTISSSCSCPPCPRGSLPSCPQLLQPFATCSAPRPGPRRPRWTRLPCFPGRGGGAAPKKNLEGGCLARGVRKFAKTVNSGIKRTRYANSVRQIFWQRQTLFWLPGGVLKGPSSAPGKRVSFLGPFVRVVKERVPTFRARNWDRFLAHKPDFQHECSIVCGREMELEETFGRGPCGQT